MEVEIIIAEMNIRHRLLVFSSFMLMRKNHDMELIAQTKDLKLKPRIV
jgi:hypothetical protein